MKQVVIFVALVYLSMDQDWGDEDVCHHESKEKEGARGLGDAVDAYAASAVTPTNKTNFDEDIATWIAFGKFLLPTLPILQGPGSYLGLMGRGIR